MKHLPADGPSVRSLQKIWEMVREGLVFSVAKCAQNINNNVDKAVLASVASGTEVAIYAVAYKVVDVSFTPVKSLLMVSYRDYFHSGRQGLMAALALTRNLIRMPLVYGLLVGLVCSLAAHEVLKLFGSSYSGGAACLRYLAWIPVLRVLQYYFGDALTGAGLQSVRTLVQCIMAGLNLVACLVVIARFGLIGATWISLIADAILAGGIISCAIGFSRRPGAGLSQVARAK